jgi:hypothetical protein
VARLVAQTLGLAIASGLVYVLVHRGGVRLPVPRAVAVTVVAVVAVTAVAGFRESWKALDDQREQNAGVTREAARTACLAGVGGDPQFVGWLAARIPPRERFHMEIADERDDGAGAVQGGSLGTCARFLLLPRVHVGDSRDARYLVFWDDAESLAAGVRRRGGTIETYGRGRGLARVP